MSPALPREQRDAIRARVEAATDGPWPIDDHTGLVGTSAVRIEYLPGVTALAYGGTKENAAFIAHARTDVPALLDALDAAEEENTRLRQREASMRMVIGEANRLATSYGESADRMRHERDAARAEVAALQGRIEALADEYADAIPGFVRRLRAALAARPAPTVNAADVRAGVLAACWPNGDALDGISARTADLITASVMRHLGLTVADEGRAEA